MRAVLVTTALALAMLSGPAAHAQAPTRDPSTDQITA